MFGVCVCLGSQESDSSQTAKKDMLAALRARQEALEETLRQRIEELKSICIREAVRRILIHLYTDTLILHLIFTQANSFIRPSPNNP